MIENIKYGYTKRVKNAVVSVFLFVLSVLAVTVFIDPVQALAAPVVTSVAPSSVSPNGGDSITITGSDFVDGALVYFDNIPASSVTFISPETLTAVTPANNTGVKDVTVINPDTSENTLVNSLTYTESTMTVTSIAPTSGTVLGDDDVLISGSNFSPGVAEITKVSTGGAFSCGIYNNEAYCWGDNSFGQLGNNSKTQSRVPTPVDTSGVLAGKTITSISAGDYRACLVTSDNLAYCWGYGDNGELGNGGYTASLVPVKVLLTGALEGKTVKSISTGLFHTCVVASDDKAYCWGSNSSGQLGNNSTVTARVPVAVSTAGVLANKNIASIEAGGLITCAVTTDGQASCWGANYYGQLGNGGVNQSNTPKAIYMFGVLSNKTITSISSTNDHTCLIASDAQVYCWGGPNDYGQYGTGATGTQSEIPVATYTGGEIAGKTIVAISTGAYHTCALDSDSKAYCWGRNESGQLGIGSNSTATRPAAVIASGALAHRKITSISTGTVQTCVSTNDGAAICWGVNIQGQLGNGSTTASNTPVQVANAAIKNIDVTFGGIAATNVQIVSSTSLSAKTPAQSAGAKDVAVSRYDSEVVTLPNAYTYIANSSITSVSPANAPKTGGDTITITGTGFDANTKVKLAGNYIDTVTYIDETTLTFITPAAASAGPVDVSIEDTSGATSTLTDAFTYTIPDPVLVSVSPAVGPMNGGTSITINGTGFDANPDGATWYQVHIGDILATDVTYVNDTTLTASTPAGTIGMNDVSVSSIYTNTVTLAESYTYIAQSYAFTNTALNLSKDEIGTLVITARNGSNAPVTSTVPTTVTLATTSAGGAFARNLSEDITSRWSYTTVIIPAGQSSVNVYYKDTAIGTPTITGTVEGVASFTQLATISSPFRFVVNGVSDPIKAGVPSSVTIRVTDKNGVQRNDYTGTIVFSSDDPLATLPLSYTMKPTDYGIKTFTNGVTMGSVGEFCVTAADSVDSALVTGQQCSITVQSATVGTISKLAIITPEQHITAGNYSSPITIQTQNDSGVSVPVASQQHIYLYSPSTSAEFSNDGVTWSGTMPFDTTIETGTSSTNVYFRDSVAHTTTIKASDNSSEATGADFGWLNANQSITTGLSPPTKLRVTGLQAMLSGQKSSYMVELIDDAGNLVSTDSDITIRVDGDTLTSRFYNPATNPTRTAGPTEFIIPTGLSGVTIGFSDTTLSSGTDFTRLTFIDGRPQTDAIRLQDATKDVQIVAALPTQISLNAELTTMEAGNSTAVDIQLLDDDDQIAPAVETTVINLGSSTGSGRYSLTQTPLTPISSITLEQGQTTKRIYFQDTVAGTSTLSASRANMTSQSDSIEITTSNTTRFGITPFSSTTTVNNSSEAFTITSYDVFGNIVVQDAALNVYLYSDQPSTGFSNSPAGPWNVSSTTIPAGQSSVQFYAKDSSFYDNPLQLTVSDKSSLDTPDTDIANATASLSITSQPISSIAITSTPQTVIAGTVANKIDVELRESNGTPALQDGTARVNISISNGKFIATNDASAVTINSVAIPRGTATASFYYYSEKAGTYTINATVTGTATTTTQAITVDAAAPSKVIYELGTPPTTPNVATNAIKAVIRDPFNNNAHFNNDKTLTLASTCTTGSFSLSNTNWQGISSINITAGVSDATYYYKDSNPGTCTLTSSISGITTASQQVTINSFAVQSLVFSTTAQTIKAGEKTGVITVELRKADGSPAYQNGSTQLQLQADSGQFFANSGDTQTVSTITIAADQASASFYYSGTLSGTRTITASIAGAPNSVSQQVTITPEQASQLSFTTQPQTVPEGSPSAIVHVAIQDMYGNSTQITSNKVLNLTSTCISGTFSEDDVDWQPVASIALPSGSTDASFFYRSMIQGSCSLTVSANGLQSASQNMTISDSNFPVRIGLSVPSEEVIKGETRNILISLLDQNGDISAAKVRTTVYVSTSSDGVFNNASVVINPGSSTATVTYKNNISDQVTIYARDQVGATDSVGSLADTSATLTYIEGAPSSVKIQAPSTAPVGASTAITTSLLNTYGLPVSAASNTIVTFSSTDQTGLFYDANGNTTTQITVLAGQSQATIKYRQTTVNVATIRAQSTNLTQATLDISTISQNNISEIRFITGPQTLEVGVEGTFRVGLYDEYGNVAVSSGDITLYAQSNSTSVLSNNGQFTIPAGQSNATFTYKQNTVGPFTITVSDSLTGTSGAITTITQNGEAIVGNPKSFRITPTNTQLERGGVTNAITVELLNTNNQATPATNGGQVVNLGDVNSIGKYSSTPNGNFTSQLALTVLNGQTSATFYYRNDTSAAGTYSVAASSTFGQTLITKNASVTLVYGEPTQLKYITQPITVEANSPSRVLTIQLQNQYGKGVPANGDKTVYLSSDSNTGQFASSKVDWGVDSIIIQNGASTADFYYKDTETGGRTITASDTLPLSPDVLLANGVQPLSVIPSTNTQRIVNNFLVTNISDPQSQGTNSSLVLIARDVDGYIVENYSGTVTFTSNDPQAELPDDYTFIPSVDKGVRVFTNHVSFSTEGEMVVTATDTNGINGEQADITVGEANTNPITALAITQPSSPVTIAPNTTSPNITIELRDALGHSTNAATGGMAIRLTSSSATGQFATSTGGPWQSSLVLNIAEGQSYTNVYYRDSAVGDATITARDWNNAADNSAISNATLDVLVHRTYVAGQQTIQTLNALGQYETSAQLFAHTNDGSVTGRVNNVFNSRNLVDNQPVAVEWRVQWRQGVNLIMSDSASNETAFTFNVDPINTTAGANNFYAVAETTETTFQDSYSVVSKQLQATVSPWKTSIATQSYALNSKPVAATVKFQNNNAAANPVIVNIFLLPADATNTVNAVNVTGYASPGSTLEYSIPAGIASLGGTYKLLAVTYDADGNTTSQVVSSSFTVMETAPIVPTTPVSPTDPTSNDPSTPSDTSTTIPVTEPEIPVKPVSPEAPSAGSGTTPTPIVAGAANDALTTAAIFATYGTTLFVGIFLFRESYKEWARIHRIRTVLKREQQLANDKNTFLSLASHYLRTPITILDATVGMIPNSAVLKSVVTSLRLKADALLENGVATTLADINSPDIQKITRTAFASIYFWLPIVVSIALTLAVTLLLNTAASGVTLNDTLVYTAIIVSALVLIVGFGARTLYINKEVSAAKQIMEQHRSQLFSAKTSFITALQTELSNEILQLREALSTNTTIPLNVKPLIEDGTQRLQGLVSKLSVIANINGVSMQADDFTPQELVQSSIQMHQTEIEQKNLVVEQNYTENAKVTQDQRMLRYVTGTVLNNAVMFSQPNSHIEINSTKKGRNTQVSITNEDSSFGSAETISAMFEPFNHATHENDLTVDGIGLSLYLDKLIMEHLGGSISASNSALRHSATINILFPSAKSL
ncbi:MAG: Outer rane autotransporter barrel [Candidatus Saccharibacteria bacterium]|nr:Outer rane autotransporter barrel [Candidatus Saccharibacteria bacterium]